MMKKLLYAFMMLFVLAGLLSACGDDDDNEYTFTTSAEKDAAGTYVGNFVRVQSGTTDTTYAAGSLTIEATDTRNLAKVSFSSTDFEEMDTISAINVNISHADKGYTFYNKSGVNAVIGRVADDQSMRTTFSKAIRLSARRTIRYNYEFVGQRQ